MKRKEQARYETSIDGKCLSEAWAAAMRFCDDRKTLRGQTSHERPKLLNEEEIKTKMMELTYVSRKD
ncbi:MAG: hypothetical protein ACLVHS_08900 [Blautia wexlerae]